MIALSRCLHPDDYQDPDLARLCETIVDPHVDDADPQHPHRRWEYALALHAIERWAADADTRLVSLLDVGGSGSPFVQMTEAHPLDLVATIVDPREPPGESIAAYAGPMVDVIVAISVIEHVQDQRSFLLACLDQLQLGGLLFLTMDAAEDARDGDAAHFHWMRERIYDQATIEALVQQLDQWGCRLFGERDHTWRGEWVFNYSFASLCVRKERR